MGLMRQFLLGMSVWSLWVEQAHCRYLCVATPPGAPVVNMLERQFQGCCYNGICDEPFSVQNAITGASVSAGVSTDTVLLFPGTYRGPIGTYSPPGFYPSSHPSSGQPVGTCASGICDQAEWWSGSITANAAPITAVPARRNVRLSLAGKNGLRITSAAGPAVTTISCEGLFDVFGMEVKNGETTATIVEGITVTKCGRPSSEENGGALRVFGQGHAAAGVTLRHVVFLDNRGLDGGAIYVNSADVRLNRVLLRGNTAVRNGGGIYVQVAVSHVADITLVDSLLWYNVAGAAGGGMYTNLNQFFSDARLNNSVVYKNQARTQGGGLYDAGQGQAGQYFITNSIVSGNTMSALSTSTASEEMYCGQSTIIVSSEPTATCLGSVGTSKDFRVSSYPSELAVGDTVVVGVDRLDGSTSRPADFQTSTPAQVEKTFFYGLPGQIWYLPPPTTYRQPVTLSVSGMTLRPFRDMIEVLVIPKSSANKPMVQYLNEMLSLECFTRPDGGDYRGIRSVARDSGNGNTPCVAWDAHFPFAHHGRNTPQTEPNAGLEDGPYCRNPCPGPQCRAQPWCYLSQQTATGKWYDACLVGSPTDICARDLAVQATFSSNSTWPVFTGHAEGMYIRLNLDEAFMTEGGLTLSLNYAESCRTKGCGGHGVCQVPSELAGSNWSPSCLSPNGIEITAATTRPQCEVPGTNNTWGLYVCNCDPGWGGVDCSLPLVSYVRVKLIVFSGGTRTVDVAEEKINLQVALTTSAANDVVRVGSETFSGFGNYDLVLGNLNLTLQGAGPLLTAIDCKHLGRGFYVDSSSTSANVVVGIEDLTITRCYANDVPKRGPRGGAVYVTQAALTIRNVIVRDNKADDKGAGIYAYRATVSLIDTVVGPNNFANNTGGGVTLEASVLLVDRTFVSENRAASAATAQLGNFACYSDSRVQEPDVKEVHWQKLGRTQVQLDVCSCCNGCTQKAPRVDVTQATIDHEVGSNVTLGALPTKVVLQGSFLSFGRDSRVATIVVDGQKCTTRNVTSSLIICSITNPYVKGQEIKLLRSDGSAAIAQANTGNASYVASNVTDTFPVYVGRGLRIVTVSNISTENGLRAKLQISLKSQPQASVTIPTSVSCGIDNASHWECIHDPAILAGPAPYPFKPAKPSQPNMVFTSENWNTVQTLELEGQDDFIISGAPKLYETWLGPTQSDDVNYKDRDRMMIPMENMEYSCPVGNTPQQYTTTSGHIKTRCVCSPGWTNDLLDPGCQETLSDPSTCKCTKCLPGTYKPQAGNLPQKGCVECPMTAAQGLQASDFKMTVRLGSTDVSECVCKTRYVLLTNTSDETRINARNLTCISCDEICYDDMGQKDGDVDAKDPSTWCVKCEKPGIELHQLQIENGWWRSSRNSSYVYRCPGQGLCLNTSGLIPENRTAVMQAAGTCNSGGGVVKVDGIDYKKSEIQNECNLPCKAGSMGVMCTACDVMWAKDYRDKGGCSSCTTAGQKLMMILVVLLLTGVLGYGVYSSIQSAEDEDRTSTMLFKILISFTLTNVEVMKYRNKWPNYLSNVFQTQSEIASKTSISLSDFPSFDCLFANTNSIDRLYNKTGFYLTLPLLSVIIPALGFGAAILFQKYRKSKMHPDSEGYKKAVSSIAWCKEVFCATVVVVVYQLYPTSVNQSAALFKGTVLQFDEEEHLDVEQSIVFSDPRYQEWTLWAGVIGLGVYAVGIPGVFGYLLYTVRETMDEDSTSRKYGFLYGGFSENRIWWEAVVMIRKLCFLLTATFLSRETVAFKVGVAMVITVSFMVFHLMAQPYPPEFMLVGLMECIGMLTIFFTYGAVLLMDEKVSPKEGEDAEANWTSRDTFFLILIMFWNLLFMVCMLLMILQDISRNAQHHVQEHGMKASFQHLKAAIKEKAKVDKIKNTLVKVTQLGSPSMRDAARETERRKQGVKIKGSLAELQHKRELRRKKDAARLMWLRGLSGASATARMANTKHIFSSMDNEQHIAEVNKAKIAVANAGRHTVTSEETQELRKENAELKRKLERLGKKNVSNMLRLGVRETKILDLQMGGARASHRPDVTLADIDANLQREEEAAQQQHLEDMKDVNAVKGADGTRKKVHQKWAEPLQQRGSTQADTGDQAVRDEGEREEEVSAAEPVLVLPGTPSPHASSDAVVALQPVRDLSQDVGNAIYYHRRPGGNDDRAAAGRKSKEFFGAVQKVKRAKFENKQFLQRVTQVLGTDSDWFRSTGALDLDQGSAAVQPSSGSASSEGSASSGSGSIAPDDRSDLANPQLRSAAERAGASASVLSSRSNAELVSAAAAERQQQQQRARKSAHLDTGASGTPLDLDAVEKGLGKVQPLSQEQIQGQVDEWNELQRQAHVRAMQTKLRMLSQFSASSLSESVNPRQGKDVAP